MGQEVPRKISLAVVREFESDCSEAKPEGTALIDLRLFENLPGLLTPQQVAHVTGFKVATVYDWKQRPWKYHIPDGMIRSATNGRRGFRVVKQMLIDWLPSRWE